MPEYPRSPFEKTGTSITPNVDGDSLNATAIGETTPSSGIFTTITAIAPNVNSLILGGASAEGGDVSIYRDTSGNKQIAIDADAASNAKALDVYGGGIFQNYLTIGQSALDITYPFYTNGDGRFSGNLHASKLFVVDDNIHTKNGKGLAGYSFNQSSLISGNILLSGTDATDHAVCMQVGGENIVCVQATGDGAGGVVETSRLVDITGQLQGNLLNNQIVQKATFDILGLMTDPRFLNLQCEDPGAGTMADVSGQGHDGTYQGSMTSGDRVKKGMGWAIDFNGSNNYVDLGDADDFSFGDGTNDEAVTFFGVFEVIYTTGYQMIIAKYDSTSGSEMREWMMQIDNGEKLLLYQYDNSASAGCQRITNTSLLAGYHSVAITSPGDGGATSMNNVKIYVDGVLVASTATNNANYVAMENLAANCLVGARISTGGSVEKFIKGDSAIVGIDGSEWSAYDVHRFHQLCKGLYGL